MIQDKEIRAIAQQVAREKLSQDAVQDVLSEPILDSEGRDALRITIVLNPDDVAGLTGDAVLDTLYEIHNKLLKAGEERTAIVEYATKEELEESDGD